MFVGVLTWADLTSPRKQCEGERVVSEGGVEGVGENSRRGSSMCKGL